MRQPPYIIIYALLDLTLFTAHLASLVSQSEAADKSIRGQKSDKKRTMYQKRHVLLFLDNCSASFKCPYKSEIQLRQVKTLNMGLKASNTTLLDSLFTIKQVWQNKVTPATILNCFRKAGFIYETPEQLFQVLEDDQLPTSKTLTEVETHEELEESKEEEDKEVTEICSVKGFMKWRRNCNIFF